MTDKPAAPQPDRLAAFKALAEKWKKLIYNLKQIKSSANKQRAKLAQEMLTQLCAAIAEAEKGEGT